MEITCIKPKPPRFFGICETYVRYKRRKDNYFASLPHNGDRIKITYLPPSRNAPLEINAYIGMEGTVENMNMVTGGFDLNTGNSILIVTGCTFKYTKA